MPAKGTLVYELLRIGLRYDHADMDGETWDDYASGLTATFTSREADKVTFTDIDTHMSQVVSVSDCSKKSIRNMAGNLEKANLTVRNFPSTVAELRKKWKLAEGGEDYLFATTVADGSFAIIHCKKA